MRPMRPSDLVNKVAFLFSGNYVVAGIGSPLRGDDRAGLLLCERLNELGISCVNCEYGLENCVDEIGARGAERLIVLDAVICNSCEPGDVIIADEGAIQDLGIALSTHAIPVSMVLGILREFGVREVYVIGIAPRSLDISTDISPEVLRAIEELAAIIARSASQKEGEEGGGYN